VIHLQAMFMSVRLRRFAAALLLLVPLASAAAREAQSAPACASCRRSCCCRPPSAGRGAGACRLERSCGRAQESRTPLVHHQPALVVPRQEPFTPDGARQEIVVAVPGARETSPAPPDQPPETIA
jgi:hypothetical protein